MKIDPEQFKEIKDYLKELIFIGNENQHKNNQILNHILDLEKCQNLIELGYKVILNGSIGTEKVMKLFNCSRTWALNRMKKLAEDPRFILRSPFHKGEECKLIFDETNGMNHYIEGIIRLFGDEKKILTFAQIRDGLNLEKESGLEIVQKLVKNIQRRYPERFEIVEDNKLLFK